MPSLFEQYLVIDYGTTHIKGVLYQVFPGSKKILRVESLPMVSLGDTEEDLEKPEGSSEYEYNIVRFVQSFFPEERNYIINIPVQQTFIRDLSVPIVNLKQINEVVPFEVENLIPVALDDAEVLGHAWHIGDESSNVITFTTRHELLETAVEPFIRGDSSIRMLSLDSVGLAGMVKFLQPDEYEEKIIGQVDIGGEQTIFNVLKNGELVFTRQIAFGGDQITSIIAKVLQMDHKAAEQKKIELQLDLGEAEKKTEEYYKRHRIPPEKYRLIIKKAGEAYINLVKELERSLPSLRCRPPEIYYLSGGGALQPGIPDLLETFLETKTVYYPLNLEPEGNIAQWATALGTGEHYRLKAAEQIDFLKTPFGSTLRRGHFNFNIFLTPVLFTVISLIFLLASFLIGVWADNKQIRAYKANIKKVAGKIPGLKASGRDVGSIVAQAEKLCNRKMKAQISRSGSVSTLDLMKEISDRMPTAGEMFFRLKRFNYNGKAIQFVADVNNYDNISLLENKLRQSQFFPDVQVIRQNRYREKIRVTMKLTLKQTTGTAGGKCK